MIILIHGDNQLASRTKLNEFKKDREIITLDAQDEDIEKRIANLQSESLLDDTPLIILENFLDSSSLEEIAKKGIGELIFWERKKVSTTNLTRFNSLFAKAQVLEFREESVVFRFLDTLAPGAQKIFIPLWNTYIENEIPEIALTMIVRQFRFLILSLEKDNITDGPDDYLKLPDWQKNKLKQQAQKFGEKLIPLYKKLYELDSNSKTSKLPEGSLTNALELFLLTL